VICYPPPSFESRRILPVPNRWTPRLASTPLRLAGLLLAGLLLAACSREPAPVPGAPQEPVAAVEALAAALRDGDLVRYSELSLPPALREQRVALWQREMAVDPPLAPEQVQRYNEMMAMLTAPDAEAVLWAKAQPRLAAMAQDVGPKWTMGVTMLSGFATTAIAAAPALSEAEKAHATGVVEAFAEWAGDRARFTDEARAREAIALAVRTARELDLPTLDAARALQYDALLGKAGVAFRGAKSIAAAYGIDADAALSQVQAEVIAIDGPRALVRVRYPLLGKEVRFEQPMVQIDGGWYREDAVQALEQALADEATGREAPATAAEPAAAAPAATP
jgi:hypothetical protein